MLDLMPRHWALHWLGLSVPRRLIYFQLHLFDDDTRHQISFTLHPPSSSQLALDPRALGVFLRLVRAPEYSPLIDTLCRPQPAAPVCSTPDSNALSSSFAGKTVPKITPDINGPNQVGSLQHASWNALVEWAHASQSAPDRLVLSGLSWWSPGSHIVILVDFRIACLTPWIIHEDSSSFSHALPRFIFSDIPCTTLV